MTAPVSSPAPAAPQPIEVVCALLTDADGRVLCTRRGATRHAYTAWKYEFPGGKIEPHETPEAALRREMREELDLDVTVGAEAADVTHAYPDFTIRLRAFRCTADTAALRLHEHTALQWLPPERLAELDLAAADREIVRRAYAF